MLKDKDKLVRSYVASISVDHRLWRYDIEGSIAHVRMLAKQGIIADSDATKIAEGLSSIAEEIEGGRFQFKSELEDIHMNIEARLFEKIGSIAGKLHTGRSRNDQIALDMRLFLKEETKRTTRRINDLQLSLVELAEKNRSVIMPGYTHLQQAQPVLLAHHLLAYCDMFQRDIDRFYDCLERTDALPLGSGALAGVAYPIDREFLAQQLGFSHISTNSLDAVSDRDFVIEYEAASAITMMHLSRLAEEIVLWASSEFSFVKIGSSFTTGSSIMPQKRNPDVAELARGKTGRVYGNLLGMMVAMKSLPLAYNRDLQEDKESLFDTVDTLNSSLEIFAAMLKTVEVNARRMRDDMEKDYLLATDLADYLVKKGIPFREAHGVVSKISEYAQSQDKGFGELSLEEYRRFSRSFEEDILSLGMEDSLAARDVAGGTAPRQVERALERIREKLSSLKEER